MASLGTTAPNICSEGFPYYNVDLNVTKRFSRSRSA